jgi:hypothetical protein
MRVWYIDKGYLDGQRLLAAHNELHALLTCVRRGRRWGNFTEQYKYCMNEAVNEHTRILEEMASRQNKSSAAFISSHRSLFLLEGLPEDCNSRSLELTHQMYVTDVQQLREKWRLEGYYFGVGRLDLRQLEESFGLPTGPSPEEALIKKASTRDLIKTHKIWFSEYQKKYPKSRLQDRLQAFLKL